MADKVLTEEEKFNLLEILKVRFENNKHRHKGVDWHVIEPILLYSPIKLWSIYQMEITGGEPDLIILENNNIAYCDCSKESPQKRRSLCYDKEAWDSRKENKPIGNVIDMVNAMGIQLLTEQQYNYLQNIEEFDLKTSSWLLTPESIRIRKGAIFGDRRYDHVFTYHNGAESYYAARGFRGMITLLAI